MRFELGSCSKILMPSLELFLSRYNLNFQFLFLFLGVLWEFVMWVLLVLCNRGSSKDVNDDGVELQTDRQLWFQLFLIIFSEFSSFLWEEFNCHAFSV